MQTPGLLCRMPALLYGRVLAAPGSTGKRCSCSHLSIPKTDLEAFGSTCSLSISRVESESSVWDSCLCGVVTAATKFVWTNTSSNDTDSSALGLSSVWTQRRAMAKGSDSFRELPDLRISHLGIGGIQDVASQLGGVIQSSYRSRQDETEPKPHVACILHGPSGTGILTTVCPSSCRTTQANHYWLSGSLSYLKTLRLLSLAQICSRLKNQLKT